MKLRKYKITTKLITFIFVDFSLNQVTVFALICICALNYYVEKS